MSPPKHEPTVLKGGGAAWVTCSCGWTGRMYVKQWRAQLEWAEHVRDSREVSP